MPGLSLAPSKVQKFKKTPWARKKMSVKSKAKAERDRKTSQPERQRKREQRLTRRAERREEKRQLRAESGEPPVAEAKSKRDPRSHHGAEQVDATILKVLGKSHKMKVAGRGKPSELGKRKAGTKQETKWNPGMREVVGERMQRMQKRKQGQRLVREAKRKRISRKETKALIGGILSDLLTSLPVSDEKVSHPSSDEAEGICEVGEDLEADQYWNPLEADRVEMPDFPPTSIHPKPSTPIHPKPSLPIHPKSSTPIHPTTLSSWSLPSPAPSTPGTSRSLVIRQSPNPASIPGLTFTRRLRRCTLRLTPLCSQSSSKLPK